MLCSSFSLCNQSLQYLYLMDQKIALVVGATGLVGTELVQLLLNDERFSLVKIFGRRTVGFQHQKLQEHVIDFENPAQWQQLVTGDVLFSSLGTTLKQAKTKEAQYKVDHTYQYNAAKAAAENKVPVYVLVSAAMASVDSRIFYSRMKGELERDIKELPFQNIHIMQPGMLDGDRKENRTGEKVGIAVLRFLNNLGLLKNQKPIHVKTVAQAMINVSFNKNNPVNTYTLRQVFAAAENM